MQDSKYLAIMNIQYALGYESKGMPQELKNKLIEEAPIKYKYLDDNFFAALEKKGIPAKANLPFAANWLAILEEERKKNAHTASWIATLLYVEWGMMYWLYQTSKLGLIDQLAFKNLTYSFIEKQHGKGKFQPGTSPNDLRIKWWLDDLVLKIRALWDKLPYAIAESNVLQ